MPQLKMSPALTEQVAQVEGYLRSGKEVDDQVEAIIDDYISMIPGAQSKDFIEGEIANSKSFYSQILQVVNSFS